MPSLVGQEAHTFMQKLQNWDRHTMVSNRFYIWKLHALVVILFVTGCSSSVKATNTNTSTVLPINIATYTPTGTPIAQPFQGKIAFVSFRNGENDIYVMNADGSGQKNFTEDLPGSYPETRTQGVQEV